MSTGQIQYITIVDSKCCGGVPTTFQIPIGATPYEISEITGASIERAIELWETRISERPDLCPILYFNELISRTLFKNDCPIGQSGSSVVVEIPEGMFSSQLSQKDANDKAESYFKEYGQKLANELGTCFIPDCSSCQPYRVSKTTSCGEFRINTTCLNGRCTDIGNEYFICLSGNCRNTTCITPCVECSPTCPNGDCPNGFTCNHGNCVAICDNQPCSIACLTGNCPEGQTCINGKCEEIKENNCLNCSLSCPNGSCSPGFTCINGQCVPDCNGKNCSITCLNGSCPSGQECKNRVCVPIQSSNCVSCSSTCPNGNCPNGFDCINGQCIANCENSPCSITCLSGNCPTGETCINGVCTPIATSTCLQCSTTCLTGSCPPNFKCVNGICIIDCINAECSQNCPSGNCPENQNCVNGVCQDPPPPPPAPLVQTTNATQIIQTAATLTATINPLGFATTVYFEYSLNNDLSNPLTTPVTSIGSSNSIRNFTWAVTTLPNTTYYFRIIGQNINGVSTGSILSFTTPNQVIPPPPPPPLPAKRNVIIVVWDSTNLLGGPPESSESFNFINGKLLPILSEIKNENSDFDIFFTTSGGNVPTFSNPSSNILFQGLQKPSNFTEGLWVTYPVLFQTFNDFSNIGKVRMIIFQERSTLLRRNYTLTNPPSALNTFSSVPLARNTYDMTPESVVDLASQSPTISPTSVQYSLTAFDALYSYLLNNGVTDQKYTLYAVPRINTFIPETTASKRNAELIQRARHLVIAGFFINGGRPTNFGFLEPSSLVQQVPNISPLVSVPLNTKSWVLKTPTQNWTINNPFITNNELKSDLLTMIN